MKIKMWLNKLEKFRHLVSMRASIKKLQNQIEGQSQTIIRNQQMIASMTVIIDDKNRFIEEFIEMYEKEGYP